MDYFHWGPQDDTTDNFTESFNDAEDSFMSQSTHMLESLKQNKTQSNEFDPEVLIGMIKNFPCLWNVNLNSHKDIIKRQNAWQQISNAFDGAFTGMM